MSTLEFVLVAHAIIVGLAVSEILRGFSELIRSDEVQISYRLLLIATWTLVLLLQIWWAIWSVGDHEVWTFLEFLLFLLPVGILYVIARLCFPLVLTEADLNVHYLRVGKVIWWLVAVTYALKNVSEIFLLNTACRNRRWHRRCPPCGLKHCQGR